MEEDERRQLRLSCLQIAVAFLPDEMGGCEIVDLMAHAALLEAYVETGEIPPTLLAADEDHEPPVYGGLCDA
jgi:hypothetical protein